jgi:hypothetical protein
MPIPGLLLGSGLRAQKIDFLTQLLGVLLNDEGA